MLGLTELTEDVAPLDHRYESPPVAVNAALPPGQMETSCPADPDGNAETYCVTVVENVQPSGEV
jgi:hypothetical protein